MFKRQLVDIMFPCADKKHMLQNKIDFYKGFCAILLNYSPFLQMHAFSIRRKDRKTIDNIIRAFLRHNSSFI